MSDERNTLIGHILHVRGNNLLAKLLEKDEGFSPVIRIGEEEHQVGQVGAYVTVRQNAVRILAIIRSIEAPPGSFPRSAAGCLINLTPLGEVSDAGAFRRGVGHYPTPGAEVRGAGQQEISAIFASTRSQNFSLGYLSGHPSVGVYLNASAMFSRHFAILGQSGSGKSWTVASLIQNAVKAMPKAHIILLDLHGEYSWKDDGGVLESTFNSSQTRFLDANQLEIPYWLMTFAELVDLFIDRSDPGATVQTAFMRQTILALKQKAAKELGLESVSIDAPVYFPLAAVYKYFKEANELYTDFGKTKGPLNGQFDKLLIRMVSRMNDVRYDFLLNPKRRINSLALAGLLRDFVGLGSPKCQISVIDLSAVPFDVLPMVSAQIGRLAFEFNFWNPRHNEFPILLLCEEAHSYIPRESSSQFEGTRRSMERIAKEGRKYGVGLGVISQRPHDLSESVLSQCGTFLCLRVTNPDDQEYVRKLVPESEGDLLDTLAALNRGEALVLGEAAPLPVRFQVSAPTPPPKGNDADYYRGWTAGPDDLDMEAIAERWRRQGR